MTVQLERPTGPDLVDLVARRVPGYSLEAPFYTSQEVFDLDVRAIFAAHWLFAAAEAELPEPGDFVTVAVGSYSVIIVRDDDEELRAFHNVCRHRGSRLLDEPRGSVGNLVCPYHHWTYGVDGRLLHADNQPASFDRSCFSLRPVHVRSTGGLVFLCLADDPPADFDKVAAQDDIVETGNWKLVMENNRECYHCDGHPELVSAYFPLFGYSPEDLPPRLRPVYQRYDEAAAALRSACVRQGFPIEGARELDTRATGFQLSHAPLDGAGKSFNTNGESVCSRLMGSMTTDRFGDLSLHVQPNSWFHVLADHAVVFSVLPLAPDRTLLRTTWLVHPDAVEGVDYDVATLTRVWQATNQQDGTLVARTHKGVEDPGYRPGPYSTVEGDVEAFVTWYVSRLAAHLSR
jgi:Rieske 2Fe-2S family protein